MQFSNPFVIIYIVGTVFSVCLNQWLEYIDFSFRKRCGRKIPEELVSYTDSSKLEKTCRYEDAKYFVWIPSNLATTVVDVLLLFCGFYPWLFFMLWNGTGNVYLTVLLFALCVSIPGGIISLPFSLYNEFKVEKKFGFSTMTLKLWLQDRIKAIVINLIVSAILLLVVVALFENETSSWWWMLGIVYVLFSFNVSIVYPLFIAPLFNKFTPLEDGELKTRITAVMAKAGFKANGMYVMDASKRSRHSNAYFTGIGKSKRIVLYDTLITQLSVDEIEAVVGHELGHYKRHHMLKRLCFMVPLIFIVLYVMNLFIGYRPLYSGFGFQTPETVFPHMMFVGLFLLAEIFGGYGDIPALIGNYFSRRDEFAADSYAMQLCGSGQSLATALIKLHSENLSEITPPKIYSLFNYDHPPLLERIRAVGYVTESFSQVKK